MRLTLSATLPMSTLQLIVSTITSGWTTEEEKRRIGVDLRESEEHKDEDIKSCCTADVEHPLAVTIKEEPNKGSKEHGDNLSNRGGVPGGQRAGGSSCRYDTRLKRQVGLDLIRKGA